MFEQAQVFASAARTANPTAAVVPVYPDAEAVELVITVTAIAATPSVVFNIDFPDADGTFATSAMVLASAAVVGTGTTRLRIGLNVATTANLSIAAALPSHIRVRPVHGDADSITYAVTAWFRG
jgi:hypothetical protein